MNKKGRMIVVSGPSGVGKTTLLKMLLDKHKNDIQFSVSYTSRLPRNGEQEEVDYHFVTKEEFISDIGKDLFLEYALVHGNYYGTSKLFVERILEKGMDCLLDIDVQGGLALMAKRIKAIYIFIAPPSIDTLMDRLLKRSTEPIEIINRRVENAKKELEQKDKYDNIIINDDINKAYYELESIIY